MRLSKRIYDIANTIKPGETIADIGTDHGYVPMILAKNNVSPYVIMSDISADSLAKAKETFNKSKISALDDQFRVGDGLDPIKKSEVDTLIIAGLGGYTIINILDKDIDKSKSFKRLVLQPRKFSGNLRYYLYTHGWDIESEHLSPEGKFVCEIISAVKSDSDRRNPLFKEDDIRWKYPPSFKNVNQDVLKKRLDWKISSIDNEIKNLLTSNKDYSTEINKLKDDKEYLINLLK